jgi:hypothetical protein
MDTRKKLKAYVRFDGSGRVVPGSMVLRQSTPKVGRWQEIIANECCGPVIPPVVATPAVGLVAATEISITWTAATVASGQNPIIHYIMKLDGAVIAYVAAAATLAYTFTALTTATSYDITVEACTADGCTSSAIVTQVTA